MEGEDTRLGWTIGALEDPGQILLLKVTATNQNGVQTVLPIYGARSGVIDNLDLNQCQQEFRVLTCEDIPFKRLDANFYNLELSGTARGLQGGSVELVGKNTIIEVLEPPIEITNFTVNGQRIHPPSNPPLTALCSPSGSIANIAWSVRGKDVTVDVGELRNYGPQYETQIFLPTVELLPQQYKLQLKAKNNDGFAVESNVLTIVIDPNDCQPPEEGDDNDFRLSLPDNLPATSNPQFENLMILADFYGEVLEEQSKEIQTLIQDRLKRDSSLPVFRPPGKFVDPIYAPVTSEFGYRTHPISGAQRLHAGRDYGADTGTPIVAAEDGEVIYAAWMQGYGNTVIIDHGGGITTLYAHAIALVASEGEMVKAGETIALLGSTGYSTGPLLHFEVHENGNPVDPRGYVN